MMSATDFYIQELKKGSGSIFWKELTLERLKYKIKSKMIDSLYMNQKMNEIARQIDEQKRYYQRKRLLNV